MAIDSSTPITAEHRAALGNVFGYMRELCEFAGWGLSRLEDNVNLASSSDDEDVADTLTWGKFIIIIDKPQPPQPPTSMGGGCYLPGHIRDQFAEKVDVEGLDMIFEHLRSICGEILSGFPTPTDEMS